jgi:hypothetical protein
MMEFLLLQPQIALRRRLFQQLVPLLGPAHSFGLLTTLSLRYDFFSGNLGTFFFDVLLDEVAAFIALYVCRVRSG